MSLSLLLVAALLFYRRLDYGLGCFCVVAALLGYFWSTLLILPYLVIAWRALRRLDRPVKTSYPLFIGKCLPGTSSEWIMAVGMNSCKASSDEFNDNGPKSELFLVTEAEAEASSGSGKQFKWIKADLEKQKYHLYQVGWSPQKPDVSAVTSEPTSPGYSCLKDALGSAIQISNLKLYTYFSCMIGLRRHIIISYALLILLAWCGGFDMQLAMINFIAAVEIYWLHLDTQFEDDTILDWLKKIYALIVSDYENVPVDLTLKPEITGRDVVDTVIDQIKRSEIFGNDFGYIRRIAAVESNYGLDHAKTFRPGYHGGIWQMDEAIFEKTKDTSSYPALNEKYDEIDSEFDIDWPNVKWEDLRKPFHGGLASHLYMNTCANESIPSSVQDQARHWKNNYNREEAHEEKFVERVIDIEEKELGGKLLRMYISHYSTSNNKSEHT